MSREKKIILNMIYSLGLLYCICLFSWITFYPISGEKWYFIAEFFIGLLLTAALLRMCFYNCMHPGKILIYQDKFVLEIYNKSQTYAWRNVSKFQGILWNDRSIIDSIKETFISLFFPIYNHQNNLLGTIFFDYDSTDSESKNSAKTGRYNKRFSIRNFNLTSDQMIQLLNYWREKTK